MAVAIALQDWQTPLISEVVAIHAAHDEKVGEAVPKRSTAMAATRKEVSTMCFSCESSVMGRERFLKMGAGALAGATLIGLGARQADAVEAPDYPKATWRPAHSDNYTDANREESADSQDINLIVVHALNGEARAGVDWFQSPLATTSAHYIVGRAGNVYQCVRHEDIAWHAGNWPYNVRSIGIEHAAYHDRPRTWTDELYRSSARLAAYCCKRHRIPVDREHIIRHSRVPDGKEWCPGPAFDMDRYIRLVRNYRSRL